MTNKEHNDKVFLKEELEFMKNRLNKYRDDLDFPEWMAEYEEQLAQLYASYVAETGSAQEFQSFCIGMYIETTHAANIVERKYNN